MEIKRKTLINGSLRNRLIGYFLVLIIVTVTIFELFLMYTVKFYYYTSIESHLINQAKSSADLYSSYMYDLQLEDVILQDQNQFFRLIDSQVQVLNNSGVVLLDTIGSPDVGKTIIQEDVEAAKRGNAGSYVGSLDFSDEQVMAVSYPLAKQSEQVGIIRLITSLEEVNQIIRDRYVFFTLFGLGLILLSWVISIFMARSVIRPIKYLTEIAEKLANGQFQVRAKADSFDEIGKLASTMNFMAENIVKKEQLKNEFISSVSHELRTPLTSIKGWSITLMAEDQDNPIIQEGLKIIEKESDRLTIMVEELLDFSRFTSGRITLNKELINLIDIGVSINKQLMPRAKSKNIDVIINYDDDTILFTGDRDRIKQVFINLLDNAIKFTEPGGAVITNMTQDDKYVVFEIIDTGIGIDSEEISLVTGKFFKGSSSNSHTGLGLSICEEIVKLHNGKMVITSKIGEGTKIHIAIPKEVS